MGKSDTTVSPWYKTHSLYIMCAALLTFGAGCLDPVVKEHGRKVYRIDAVRCSACLKCIDPCPTDAIREIELDGIPAIVIDPEKCIACGECVPHCPEEFDAIEKVNYNQ